ncbi:MAG: hypothetical protein K6F46_07335 [Desulfovibrio sp.]|nr:hypothetical protein [Desulfovibrio sp.]
MGVSSVFREIYSLVPSYRDIFNLIKYVALCIFTVFLLLFVVSMLPTDNLRKNLIQASNDGYFDKDYPSPDYLFFLDSRVDMYTECIGIGASAKLAPNVHSVLSMKHFGECQPLKNAIDKNFASGGGDYFRYIHGYQIVLKSLYTYFDIKHVRICIFSITLLLFVITFFVLTKNINLGYSITILLSFLITKSSDVFLIATHASQLWVVLIGTWCAVLLRHNVHAFVLFGVIGSADACFTFLNMGSLSLSLPLLCYSLALWNDNECSEKNITSQFFACIGWGIGFVLPWLVKWGLVFLFFDVSTAGLFGETLNSYPTGSIGRIFLAIFKDVRELHWVLYVIIVYILLRRKKRNSLPMYTDMLPALLPSLVPFVWIAIIPGQAGIHHSTFYNMILWPTIAATFLVLLSLPSKRHDRIVSDPNSPAKDAVRNDL